MSNHQLVLYTKLMLNLNAFLFAFRRASESRARSIFPVSYRQINCELKAFSMTTRTKNEIYSAENLFFFFLSFALTARCAAACARIAVIVASMKREWLIRRGK